jgi:hypothetical protein
LKGADRILSYYREQTLVNGIGFWRTSDFLRDRSFLRRREHFGSGRKPSRRIPVFDILGTEDSETINTPKFPMVCIS